MLLKNHVRLDSLAKTCSSKLRGGRFQFSLRALLIFVIVLGIILGTAVNVFHREAERRKAEVAIEQLGGIIMQTKEGLNVSLTMIPATDHDLVHLSKLSNIHTLRLDESQISDAGIKYLTGLKSAKKLKALTLWNAGH